jgi:signal transduction histidine kinase
MSIRNLTTLLLAIFVIAVSMSIYLVSSFGPSLALQHFPEVFQQNRSLLFTFLLIGQGFFLMLSVMAFGAIWYSAFLSLVIRPLSNITNAVQEFEANGAVPLLVATPGSPLEIQKLRAIFHTFAQKVADAHTHDQDMSRVKSDFISTAAHQLRTPLTGIRWALEALEKEPLPEGLHALVASAVTKSHDLVAIVGTLLDISSIESGKYKYTFSPVDITTLVATVVKDFAPLSAEMRVSVAFAQPEVALPQARADEERIKWVLNNLVENAIRYTPAGGSVHVSLGHTPSGLQVLVRDTGIGISAEDKNNIFERFYRAGNAITKENKGNGLGLYIARTIATDHGGDLTFAANAAGPGTLFTLTLPLIS